VYVHVCVGCVFVFENDNWLSREVLCAHLFFLIRDDTHRKTDREISENIEK